MSSTARRPPPLRPEKKTTAPRDLAVARRAAVQNGILTTRQLAECGLDDDAIASRVRRGHLHRVVRGVYAVGHAGLARSAKFTAAVLACGDGAVLSHYAAAAQHHMLEFDGRRPQCIVLRNGGRKIAGVRVHRCRLDRVDVWTREGISITSPARTILDLAATMAPTALRRVVRQAQAEQRVNVPQLLEVLTRHRHHRGAAKLRAAVADGPTPTRSIHEDHTLDLITDAGIERPEVNPLVHLDGRPIRPDLLWRAHGVVVECDSRRWHSDPLTRQEDADKQAILEAHGYRLLRVTWQQVLRRPGQTLARIRAALESAAPAAATVSAGRSGS